MYYISNIHKVSHSLSFPCLYCVLLGIEILILCRLFVSYTWCYIKFSPMHYYVVLIPFRMQVGNKLTRSGSASIRLRSGFFLYVPSAFWSSSLWARRASSTFTTGSVGPSRKSFWQIVVQTMPPLGCSIRSSCDSLRMSSQHSPAPCTEPTFTGHTRHHQRHSHCNDMH